MGLGAQRQFDYVDIQGRDRRRLLNTTTTNPFSWNQFSSSCNEDIGLCKSLANP